MKKRMRKILVDSWLSGKMKSCVFFIILFLTTMLLACALFFYFGDDMEETLANSMELSITLKNNHYYSKHSDSVYKEMQGTTINGMDKYTMSDYYPDLNMEMYRKFLSSLHKLMESHEVGYGNFNLVMDFKNEDGKQFKFFGIETEDFFNREGLKVVEGSKNFGEQECLVPRDLYDWNNGRTNYQVGDIIKVYGKNQEGKEIQMTTYTVKGIYETTQRIRFQGIRDDFLNASGILVWNSSLESILDNYPEQYGMTCSETEKVIGIRPVDPNLPIDHTLNVRDSSGALRDGYIEEEIDNPKYFDENGELLDFEVYQDYIMSYSLVTPDWIYPPDINHVEIIAKNLSDYNKLLEQMNQFIEHSNEEIDELFQSSILLKRNVTDQLVDHTLLSQQLTIENRNIEPVLLSIRRIAQFYSLILMSVFGILLISFVSFLYYLQMGKTREIFIYYSLGKTKKEIVKQYLKYYLVATIPISIVADYCGYLISIYLSHRILLSNFARQQEFIHTDTLRFQTEFNLFHMNQMMIPVISFVVFIISLACVVFFVYIITYHILNGKLRDHARGG